MRGVSALPGKHIVIAFVLLGTSSRLFEDASCESFRLMCSSVCGFLPPSNQSVLAMMRNPALNSPLDFITPVCPLRLRQK